MCPKICLVSFFFFENLAGKEREVVLQAFD